MGNSINRSLNKEYYQNDSNDESEEEEDTPNYILQEIEKFNQIRDPKLEALEQYFLNIIKPKYLKNFSYFGKNYKQKKNFPLTKDLLFTIHTVENIHTKQLFNLKSFRFNLREKKEKLNTYDTEKEFITNQILVLQELNSPNAEHLIDICVGKKNYFLYIMIITSWTTNVSLLDIMNKKIEKCEKFSDLEFKIILFTLLDILIDLKCANIVHRGISPCSIYFQKVEDYSSLTLKNFYFSTLVKETPPKGITGSLWYSSPEILSDSEHDYKSDIWSAGVVLYQTLTLDNPFEGTHKKEEILNILEHDYFPRNFKKLIKLNYNFENLDILKDMLHETRIHRKSIEDLISQKKIKFLREEIMIKLIKESNIIFNINISERTLNNILKIPLISNTQYIQVVMQIFYHIQNLLIDKNQYIQLNILFNFFDINNNNSVSTDEFKERMKLILNHKENSNENIHNNKSNHNFNLLNNTNSKQKKDMNNSVEHEDYCKVYKICIEIILKNEYYYNKRENFENKKFNFEDFCVLALIFSFYDDKKKNDDVDLNNNNNINRSSQFNYIGDNSSSCEKNLLKLLPVFNYLFEGKTYIPFLNLNFDTENFNNQKIYELRNFLITKYSKNPIFIKGADEIDYISRENFTRLLQLDFLEKK